MRTQRTFVKSIRTAGKKRPFNPSVKSELVISRPFKKARYSSRLTAIPPELKFFDTAVSFTPDSTLEVPATGQWCLIPQGDTESTRDGRIAVIRSFQFRGTLVGPINTSPADAYVNLWVVLDTQANGAAATAADVFNGADFYKSI